MAQCSWTPPDWCSQQQYSWSPPHGSLSHQTSVGQQQCCRSVPQQSQCNQTNVANNSVPDLHHNSLCATRLVKASNNVLITIHTTPLSSWPVQPVTVSLTTGTPVPVSPDQNVSPMRFKNCRNIAKIDSYPFIKALWIELNVFYWAQQKWFKFIFTLVQCSNTLMLTCFVFKHN